jgi:DNA-binding transcriptional MocR family regulator
VAVFPGRFFTPSAAETRDLTLRLTFADKEPEQLEEATRRLALALRTVLAREPREPREQSATPARRFTADV